MSMNIEKNLNKIMLVTAMCGTVGAGLSMTELVQDAKTQAPERYIGPDGHAGIELSGKQNGLLAGAIGGATLAVSALAFGRALRKEREKEQEKATRAALLATKQMGR